MLLGIMNLHKASVRLALSIDDFELAKEFANKASPVMQKELWLIVIQEMIKANDSKKNGGAVSS